MSADGNGLSDGSTSYGTLFASRNARAVPSLIAKFAFCGNLPVRRIRPQPPVVHRELLRLNFDAPPHPFGGVDGAYNCDIGGSTLTIVSRMERRFSPIGMEFAWPSFDVDSKREPTMQTIVIYITPPILFYFGLGLSSLFFSN